FTRGRSTTTALTRVVNDVLEGRRDRLTALLSIDFSKAFDNARWSDIISNMIGYGFPPYLISVLRSYLEVRSVRPTHNGNGYPTPTTNGCPQGSPLSPILWNLLINPLLSFAFPEGTTIVAYADDISIVCTDETAAGLAAKIQTSLDVVDDWSQA